MANEDFELDSLAKYLHMMPAQVARLADRGKLPGRKVGGQWRFSRPEIHHWLEHRIGLSDEEELVQMEGVLRRAAPPGEDQPISICQLLRPEAIAVPLAAKTRSRVTSAMIDLAAETGLVWDVDKLTEAVRAREDMQSTALDIGVALLHPRRPMPSILGEALLALGTTPSGIPFGASRGTLTDIFFLILSVDDQGHLRVLARLSRLISDPKLLEEIRQAGDAQMVYELIRERDADLG